MELTGKTYKVGAEQKVTDSYKKRELIIVTDEQFPQNIMIEFPQGKCNDYLDKLSKGQEVKVSINIGGRLWTDANGIEKCFNSIKGWRIEATKNSQNVEVVQPLSGGSLQDDVDDLPF